MERRNKKHKTPPHILKYLKPWVTEHDAQTMQEREGMHLFFPPIEHKKILELETYMTKMDKNPPVSDGKALDMVSRCACTMDELLGTAGKSDSKRIVTNAKYAPKLAAIFAKLAKWYLPEVLDQSMTDTLIQICDDHQDGYEAANAVMDEPSLNMEADARLVAILEKLCLYMLEFGIYKNGMRP
jgi:hypothetical protein